MVVHLFEALVICHIITGTVGLIGMWVPVITAKGTPAHRNWGRIFVGSMLLTGTFAVAISICSLIDPLGTHTFSTDAVMVRGLFGWMMLYLGVLTIALAWHSYVCVRFRSDDAVRRHPGNVAVQAAMGIMAVLNAVMGVAIDQPIMVGVAVPGFAAAILNSQYLVQDKPIAQEWLVQHFRAGIGAGISVYTAFLAFGAVNLMPVLAFNPVLWALPTVLGVGYMIHHQLKIYRQRVRRGLADQMPVGRYFAHWVAAPVAPGSAMPPSAATKAGPAGGKR